MAIEERRSPFRQQLQTHWDAGKFVCVGLDPDWNKIPPHLKDKFISPTMGTGREKALMEFAEKIVDSTGDLVCAYKPNIAFYEGFYEGQEALEYTVRYIKDNFPEVPIIGDVKRADIGNTNRGYAEMAFGRYQFDAITTNPYFGHDTYPPFLSHEGRGLIALCKTSNPGAALYQDAPVDIETYQHIQEKNGTPLTDGEMELAYQVAERYEKEYEDSILLDRATILPLYCLVALRTATLARENPNIGLVVGATHPETFEPVRMLAPDALFLIPGIGSQGGDLEKTLKFAPDSRRQGMIINSASGIIFASSGEDFADKAREATIKLDKQIKEGLGIV